jgi:hypothetical protein
MMKNKAYLSGIKGTPTAITLLMLFFALSLFPQVYASCEEKQPSEPVITVSGYVICRGERIAEVTVEAESTNDVSISDSEGKFSVTVKKGGILLFHKNGYTIYELIANEPQENLIVCLLSEAEPNDGGKVHKKASEHEKEIIINIKTKKKR